MASFKLQNGVDELTPNTVRLRSKFIKNFPDLTIQETVLHQCEKFIKLSVYDAFNVLMKTASSATDLLAFTHLEHTEISDPELVQSLWNELRSQYSTVNHVFSEYDLFGTCNGAYMRICNKVSTEYAFSIFKYLCKYFGSHDADSRSRLTYLLSSDLERYQVGGLYELKLDPKKDPKLIQQVGSIGLLAKDLLEGNCYLQALDWLDYCFPTTSVSSSNNEIDEKSNTTQVSKLIGIYNSKESNVATNNFNSTFSISLITKFTQNYELLDDTFACFADLRKAGIEPLFLLMHENEFIKCLDNIDNIFKPQQKD